MDLSDLSPALAILALRVVGGTSSPSTLSQIYRYGIIRRKIHDFAYGSGKEAWRSCTMRSSIPHYLAEKRRETSRIIADTGLRFVFLLFSKRTAG